MRRVLSGWTILSGLVLSASAAAATVIEISDIGPAGAGPYGPYDESYVDGPPDDGPYAAVPPPPPPRATIDDALSPREVVRVMRIAGYAPLGRPARRGVVYTIAALDPRGDDGRVVIDARSGRIIRFVPALADEDVPVTYGVGPLPPPPMAVPRPPARVPRIASHVPSPPLPRAAPHAVVAPKAVTPSPAAAAPAAPPLQQQAQQPPSSSAGQEKPAAEAPAAAAPAPAASSPQAPPAVTIQPTRPMPPAQGFE